MAAVRSEIYEATQGITDPNTSSGRVVERTSDIRIVNTSNGYAIIAHEMGFHNMGILKGKRDPRKHAIVSEHFENKQQMQEELRDVLKNQQEMPFGEKKVLTQLCQEIQKLTIKATCTVSFDKEMFEEISQLIDRVEIQSETTLSKHTINEYIDKVCPAVRKILKMLIENSSTIKSLYDQKGQLLKLQTQMFALSAIFIEKLQAKDVDVKELQRTLEDEKAAAQELSSRGVTGLKIDFDQISAKINLITSAANRYKRQNPLHLSNAVDHTIKKVIEMLPHDENFESYEVDELRKLAEETLVNLQDSMKPHVDVRRSELRKNDFLETYSEIFGYQKIIIDFLKGKGVDMSGLEEVYQARFEAYQSEYCDYDSE